MDGDKRRDADAFDEQLADAVAGRLGRDHGHVDILRRDDLAEVDIEAMREHEGLSGLQVRGDLLLVDGALMVVGDQDHHDVGGLAGFGRGHDVETGRLGFVPVGAAGDVGNHDVDSGIPEVESVGMALAAVADDGYRAALERTQISIFFVITIRHYLLRCLG